MLVFSFILIGLLFQANSCLGCNRLNGPAGEFGCVSIPRYQDKQYANISLSAVYLREKSGQHNCEDPFATYCWYQCMLENHYENSGYVSKDCLCSEETMYSTIDPLLPEKCYSPDGRDCFWYGDCLEKKHSCVGQTGDYAIKFAEKICQLYEDNLKYFSIKGQKWVDGVRKCLQVSLVPVIRPYYKGSCDDIKIIAFDSHAPCYVTPGFGAPSICDLSCADWFTVFWTVKSSFLTSDSFRTLTGMIEVSSNCKIKVLSCGLLGIGGVAALATPWLLFWLFYHLCCDTSKRNKGDTEIA